MLYGLKKNGYQAYLVGGGVRDLLLGREPKDFDVATDAHPEEVKGVFPRCRLIGRRFRLAHVPMGREIVEVATFRGSEGQGLSDQGMILRDNIYGTLEEDALRRDFTVNALYYNIKDFSVLDYCNGVEDLRSGILRLIGDPETRYREDPVRMLRAVRFSAKLGFNIDSDCEKPIASLGGLLREVPAARLFEEMLKLFLYGTALQAFEKLRHYRLFEQLFPLTEEALTHQEREFPMTFVSRSLESTDQRFRDNKPITPTFLLAALLWEPVRLRASEYEAAGESPATAIQQASSEVLELQTRYVVAPKRYILPARDIWQMQHRFLQTQGRRPQRLMGLPMFRAAYDFLLLRAAAGEIDGAIADWWTALLEGRQPAVMPAVAAPPLRKRRRRRRSSASPERTPDE